MTDHPLLFSAPMIRALLDGRKTQTRRLFKKIEQQPNGLWHIFGGLLNVAEEDVPNHAPDYSRFQIGDRIWVRETWRAHSWAADVVEIAYAAQRGLVGWSEQHEQIRYPDGDKNAFKYYAPKGSHFWRPSIFMPRWASRLTLIVTDVRIERLQAISEEDAIAEGLEWIAPTWGIKGDSGTWNGNPCLAYAGLWDSINFKAGVGWANNPWVVAYTFTVAKQNINRIAA
ncbi:hypothetical protein ASC97_05815 [Rhizobium sp. Root1203]|uniref:hypothetical protein n=1 Tax=Rhizobium sp. Root1203 TaxID=1736427 RepID=UPI00070F9B54|nr:hypothetical protein [Rhizobium sp. Root1203]KQV27878.1 hypothetical protein ASC97_05815 [Rhizobium sp. Root1203]